MEVPYKKERAGDGKEWLVHELFELQAKRTPDQVAVYFKGQELTYFELNKKADLIAGNILKNDRQSSIVGISSTRNIHMIADLLAILKAGKAYLPLDPDDPPIAFARY